ncbi:MAG: LLM class flavin-dependent oxidoreductase [Deltaproteobacteria bacterium]|nr:LLM class flavin-dependent oxidoreductase [Deltaproteobacteria bacterium]
MKDWDQRLETLSPRKRRLVQLRLRQAGIDAPSRESMEEHSPTHHLAPPSVVLAPPGPPRAMEFSLFFFSADGSSDALGKYDLLLDCARFADTHDFSAVWTPERHFVEFGGLYPNPSVLAAALAAVTERLEIRAGSVVLPLHDPIRLAEEWSLVDNLSGGRAAIACATGWHPNDFVLRPEHFTDRREVMVRHLEELRTLWSGGSLQRINGAGEQIEVRTLPRPVQPTLPVWITSSGNLATWELAGQLGGHVLSSLGSQPGEELAKKIDAYRQARADSGYDPATGRVSLMLHTYLAKDLSSAKDRVRSPMMDYLRQHLAQRDSFLHLEGIRDQDKEELLPLAFEHYVAQASLIGTVETCSATVQRLSLLGVNELACLVDFGLPGPEVQEALPLLAQLGRRHAPNPAQRPSHTAAENLIGGEP